MKSPIRVGLIIIAVIAIITTLAGLSILGIKRAMEDSLRSETENAVMAVSGEIAMLYRGDAPPTTAAIERQLLQLRNAGISGVALDAAGKPVDVYGTPFRVTYSFEGKRHAVTAISAGPDRLFGTPDDIVRVAGWDPSQIQR